MPVDRYQCQKCGEKFDFFSRLWEVHSEINCPRCGSGGVMHLHTNKIHELQNSEDCDLNTTSESS